MSNPFQLDEAQQAFYASLPADGLPTSSVTDASLVEALEALGAVEIREGKIYQVVPEPEVVPSDEAQILESAHKAAVAEKNFAGDN